MTEPKTSNGSRSTYAIYVGLIIVSLTATFFGIQWQQTESEVNQLESELRAVTSGLTTDIEKLEEDLDAEIARLDESNRTRRNDIFELEERIARLEERVDNLETPVWR